jgi:drug/metabolite transporter (DMT)-like permease
MGIILGLLSMFGWGTSDFLAAKVSRKTGYLVAYFWTQLVAFFIALIYFLIKLPTFDINNIIQSLVFLLPAGFFFMVGTLSFYKGFTSGQVSLVSPIGSSWIVITVFLSVIFFKEVLLINQIIAIVLIIIGIILLSVNIKELLKIKKLSLLGGIKEGFIAMLAWGMCFFLIIPASKTLGWFLPVFALKSFGILFLIIYIMISKKSLKFSFQPSFLVLFFLIGLLDIIAFFSYSFGVGIENVPVVASISASFPLVTMILARIFFKEKLAFNQIIGIIGVIAGLILISI